MVAAGLAAGRYLVVRPNRIQAGTPVGLGAAWGLAGLLPFLALLLLALGAVLLALRVERGSDALGLRLVPGFLPPLLATILSAGVPAVLLLLTGIASRNLLPPDAPAVARISPGIGFWLMLAGSTLLLQGATGLWGRRSLPAGLAVLAGLALLLALLYRSGLLDRISIVRELADRSEQVGRELVRHLQLSLSASLAGLVLSVGLGYGAFRKRWLEGAATGLANFAQVMPTLSLLGLLMVPLTALSLRFPILREWGVSGVGFWPAFIVLTLYTLLPLTANTLAGFRSQADAIREAALGMGMTGRQRFFRVELPLSAPFIFAGFRTALVQTVGNCILAGLVGGGGLGTLIFLGLAQSAPDLVVAASLMVVLMAVFLDRVLQGVEGILRHRVGGGEAA